MIYKTIYNQLSIKQISLAVFSGLLLFFSFPRINLPALAWIGVVPLLWALDQGPKNSPLSQVSSLSHLSSFFLGWICGLVYFGGTLYWLIQTMNIYGYLPLWQSILIALALIAYLSLYIGGFTWLLNLLRVKTPVTVPLLAPIIWTCLEYLRSCLLTGFPWSVLGYTQYSHLPLIQFIDITGVYGLSFLLVLVNASIVYLLRGSNLFSKSFGRMEASTHRRDACAGNGKGIWPVEKTFLDRYKKIGLSIILILLLGSIEAYGIYKLHYRTPGAKRAMSVALIQGNIPQEEKWDQRMQDNVSKIYTSLTLEAAAQQPDLIIWPEASTPLITERKGDYLINVSPLAKEAKVPLFIGTPRLEWKGGNIELKNSAFLLSEKGKIIDFYDKIHLVPFGEYLPLQFILKHLGSVVNEVGEFSPGKRYTVFNLDQWRFGAVICYEIIFPSLFRQFAHDGAHFMLNLTNDAWFGESFAPYQHFSMGVFRSIENGVTLIRVANTGISGIIDPLGRVILKTPLLSRLAIVKPIEIERIPTFYSQYGDIFVYTCIILLILILMVSFLPRGQSQNRS